MTLQELRIDVDGISTRYLTAGDIDPPLVLLHGVGTSTDEWSWASQPAHRGVQSAATPG